MALLKGYLMPHAPAFIESIGGDRLHQVTATREAMYKVADEIDRLKPDLIIVISPHGPIFSDAIAVYDQDIYSGNFKAFGEYKLRYNFIKDQDFINNFKRYNHQERGDFYCLSESQFKSFKVQTELDHGILVPLHFINERFKNFKLVAMSYGSFSYHRLMKNGELLGDFIHLSDKKVVVIASGDMSHALKDSGPYEYHEDGEKFDREIKMNLSLNKPYQIFKFSNETIENAKECGLRSYAILMGIVNQYQLESKVFSYEAPFGVGYLVAALDVVGASEDDEVEQLSRYYIYRLEEIRKNEDDIVVFARRVIEAFVETGQRPTVISKGETVMVNEQSLSSDHYKQMSQITRGCFVSLHMDGSLRGCIGTIGATESNVLYEISKNAVASCSKDNRFNPVVLEELDRLEIKVDVLSELKPIRNLSALNPRTLGVVVRKGYKQGVLLPDLDGINTVDQQIEIAAQKGGFTVDEIEEIFAFSVDRYK